MAAKEKTASGGAPFAEPKTRVWGLLPGNGNGIGGCWPVTSTHVWGCWHVYAETASGGLVNRYYSNAYGRFMTPDPYANSGRSSDPQSWNRYGYTRGDPINRYDPRGTEDDAPPSYCFDDPQGMFDPICTCPNGLCIPPTGSASGSGLPPNVPCYQNYNQIQNTLNNVSDDLLSKILADKALNLTSDQVHNLTDLLLTTSVDEVMNMQGWTGQGPDPDYYKGGHFNLVLNDSDLASALGLTVGSKQFGDFQSYILSRFPTPTLGDPSLHGNIGPIRRGGTSNTDYFHLDSADAYQRFPLGAVTHFGRDVVAGQVPQWFGKYPCLDQGF